jgi:hypothetical protein
MLKANPERPFTAAGRGEVLREYIASGLQLRFEPEHTEVFWRYSARNVDR